MALTTSSVGNATLGYYAFGRRRTGAGSTPTRHQYTGQYVDDTLLYNYGARYYDPELGIFLSPDTLVPDPSHLFDHNRYMYVRGNPLRFNDPTGHIVCGSGLGGSGSFAFRCAGGGGGISGTARAMAMITAASALTVVAVDSFRETYPMPQPRKAEANGVPLDDWNDAYQSWVGSGVPDAPSSQVWADPLPQPQKGSNIVYTAVTGQENASNGPSLVYEASPKHHPNVRGSISKGPTNGQDTLNNSIQIKSTSPRRIGLDSSAGEFVVFDQTSQGLFHGHVRTWEQLTQEMQNILIGAGLVTAKGKIR